jgi:hypothetical protein
MYPLSLLFCVLAMINKLFQYLKLNPLPTLASFLSPSSSSTAQLRSKVIYALSGLLKHNAPALASMGQEDTDGWTKLRQGLQGKCFTLRVIFFFTDMIFTDQIQTSMSGAKLLFSSVRSLLQQKPRSLLLRRRLRLQTSTHLIPTLHLPLCTRTHTRYISQTLNARELHRWSWKQ